MPTSTFSLRALFIATTLCAFATFAYLYLHANSETWNSGLRDSEICSASIEPIFRSDDTVKTRQLSKRDAIRLVRLAEKCPLRAFDECPTSYLVQPETDFLALELKLSENRTLGISKIGDCLRTPDSLIDITTKRKEFAFILWPPD